MFWHNAFRELNNGILEGDWVLDLALAAAKMYPGNDRLKGLVVRATPVTADGTAEVSQGRPPEAAQRASESARPPVVSSPQADSSRGESRARHDHPTLLFIGSDQHDELLSTVRSEVAANAQLLYASVSQTAILLPDAPASVQKVLAVLNDNLAHHQPRIEITYHNYDFRPYLLQQISVTGPDQQQFFIENVPVTSTVSQVVSAVQDQYYGDTTRTPGGQPQPTSAFLHQPGSAATPLVPGMTLHEAGITEDAQLSFGPRAVAGAVPRPIWLRAVRRVQLAIERYAEQNPDFRIVDRDDVDIPTTYVVHLTEPSYALPDDFQADDPLSPVVPIRRDEHEIVIILPTDYPQLPPGFFWTTPIFHPNILDRPGDRLHGLVCLGPLLHTYRADLDFAEICEMVVDMAGYRVYETRDVDADSEGYLNRRAADWAMGEAGQEAIAAIGGELKPVGQAQAVSTGRPWPLRVTRQDGSAPTVDMG